jgi:hypothetical protein
MPRAKIAEERTEPADELTLVPFTVLIDGRDMTVYAKDADDLQTRIARIRDTFSQA